MTAAPPPEAEPARQRRALPLWLWMLLLTAAIAALLMYVGRNSFAA
ncbi:MAG: hypothetical protein ACREIP_12210 [Alphaproteobacteria bacterium]